MINNGKNLDCFINDEDCKVRCTVARYGRDKDLDVLINDKNQKVRNAYVNSINFKGDKRLTTIDGRIEMIKEGKDIDIIKKGPQDKKIKIAMIENGYYDPEKYLTDKNIEVQETARKKLLNRY